MNLEQIRSRTEEELATQAQEAAEQLFRIRFQKSMGNLEGLKNLKAHKREIARVKTVQRERQIAAVLQANPVKKASAPEPSQRTSRKKAGKA